MPTSSPIAQRLDQLHNQRVSFVTNSVPRLLVWRVQQDEASMVDTLTQRHESYQAHRRPLEEQLAKLLGADWRSQLVVTKAA